MLLSADKLHGDDDFLFHQCSAPNPSEELLPTAWFADHDITVLGWDTESTGCCQEEDKKHLTNNIEELKAAIKATWSSVTPQQNHRMMTTMPRHIMLIKEHMKS